MIDFDDAFGREAYMRIYGLEYVGINDTDITISNIFSKVDTHKENTIISLVVSSLVIRKLSYLEYVVQFLIKLFSKKYVDNSNNNKKTDNDCDCDCTGECIKKK